MFTKNVVVSFENVGLYNSFLQQNQMQTQHIWHSKTEKRTPYSTVVWT